MPDDWYVGFHAGLVARFWRAAGATMADEDARLAHKALGPPPGARVLDMPCGDGRLTVRLAAAGYTMIGVDLAAAELERARNAAAQASADATFVVGDLRAIPDVGPVDGIMSWGNSFGYLTPADTARSLASMHRTLRPQGRLVLESLTVAESLLAAGIEPERRLEFGGVRMTTHNRYRAAESRLETDYVFEDADGRVERTRGAHHVHTTGEVVRLLHDAGFAEVVLLGAADWHLPPPEVRDRPLRRIVELGTNIGTGLAGLGVRYPEAKLLGVEPDPQNAALARRNLARFGNRCRFVQAAIWDVDADLVVVRTRREWGLVVRPREATDPPEWPTVPAQSVGSVLADFEPGEPIDFLFVDIEGTEQRILEAEDTEWARRVRCIRVECEYHYEVDVTACCDALGRLGFDVQIEPVGWATFVYGVRPPASA